MARVLVIDDEEMVRQTFRLTLELAGHEVVEAANGEEGVQLYQEAPADVVVTDIKMEPKNGLEVIKELKAGFSDAKIIAITGFDPSALDTALDLGADRVFTKPLKMNELVEAIDAIMEGDS